MSDDTGHVRRNRAMWDDWAARYVADGERAWASNTPDWGIWSVPESDVGMLPADLDGCDAIELGCGTGYVSSWLARRGARVTGIDNSARQLATARRLQREHAVSFPLVHGNAENLPCRDASVDFAISEYGACLWADPYLWVPEAARVLRPGGRLLVLEFSECRVPVLDSLYDFHSFQVIPRLGNLTAGVAEPYQYLVESIRKFPKQEAFAAMIRTAGFDRVTYRDLTGGIAAMHSGWKI